MPEGDETIDDKVNAAAPRGGGIFDSIGSSLESLVGAVRAIPRVAKKSAYYTYYTAKAAAGMAAGVALAGAYPIYTAKLGLGLTSIIKAGYSALILPVGMAIGTWLSNLKNKTKTTFKQISNELAVGGILGGILSYIFLGNNKLGSVVKSAYGTLPSLLARGGYSLTSLPVFLGTHELLNRSLISDYKPQPFKDMGKRIKKMWPLIPLLLANYTVIPEYLSPAYQMPVAAGIAIQYGLLKGDKKEEKKESPETIKMPQAQPYEAQKIPA